MAATVIALQGCRQELCTARIWPPYILTGTHHLVPPDISTFLPASSVFSRTVTCRSRLQDVCKEHSEEPTVTVSGIKEKLDSIQNIAEDSKATVTHDLARILLSY